HGVRAGEIGEPGGRAAGDLRRSIAGELAGLERDRVRSDSHETTAGASGFVPRKGAGTEGHLRPNEPHPAALGRGDVVFEAAVIVVTGVGIPVVEHAGASRAVVIHKLTVGGVDFGVDAVHAGAKEVLTKRRSRGNALRSGPPGRPGTA